MRIRIPAGVRIDGRAVGGQFVSVDLLPVVAESTDDAGRVALLDVVARELDRATTRQARVERQFQDDPKRYAVRRGEAEAVREFFEDTADAIARQLAKPTRKVRLTKASKPVKKARKRSVQRARKSKPEEPEEEPDAAEWEIGFDYNGLKGRTSDVDVNIRLRRTDGKRFTRAEAMRALKAFRRNIVSEHASPIPPGYRMAAIEWRRPARGTRWRRGGFGDLENLQNLLSTQADVDAAWRLGSIEE